MNERVHVPDMHFACLGPGRDIIGCRWWGEWLPGRERLCAHAIYAAKMWNGAIFEDGVLVQIVTVIIVVVVIVVALLRLFAFYAAASS